MFERIFLETPSNDLSTDDQTLAGHVVLSKISTETLSLCQKVLDVWSYPNCPWRHGSLPANLPNPMCHDQLGYWGKKGYY